MKKQVLTGIGVGFFCFLLLAFSWYIEPPHIQITAYRRTVEFTLRSKTSTILDSREIRPAAALFNLKEEPQIIMAALSPDNKSLAFIARWKTKLVSGTVNVECQRAGVKDLPAGKLRFVSLPEDCVVNMNESLETLRWSKDGKWLAIASKWCPGDRPNCQTTYGINNVKVVRLQPEGNVAGVQVFDAREYLRKADWDAGLVEVNGFSWEEGRDQLSLGLAWFDRHWPGQQRRETAYWFADTPDRLLDSQRTQRFVAMDSGSSEISTVPEGPAEQK